MLKKKRIVFFWCNKNRQRRDKQSPMLLLIWIKIIWIIFKRYNLFPKKLRSYNILKFFCSADQHNNTPHRSTNDLYWGEQTSPKISVFCDLTPYGPSVTVHLCHCNAKDVGEKVQVSGQGLVQSYLPEVTGRLNHCYESFCKDSLIMIYSKKYI